MVKDWNKFELEAKHALNAAVFLLIIHIDKVRQKCTFKCILIQEIKEENN